jgi:aminoglycoside 3-N-acetyltransferase
VASPSPAGASSDDHGLHLAENRAKYKKTFETFGAPVIVNGRREWLPLTDIASDEGDFEKIGEAFENSHPAGLNISKIGSSTLRFFPQQALVDFAVDWMSENRV